MAAYVNHAGDGTAFSRPATVPGASDTVLVSKTEYNDNGEALTTTDHAGKVDRAEFDDAVRRTKTIENYDDGNSATGATATSPRSRPRTATRPTRRPRQGTRRDFNRTLSVPALPSQFI